MADQKLSQLAVGSPATTPLTGNESVYVVQSGQQKATTAQAIANKAPGTDLTYTAGTRTLASSTGADVVLPLATTTDAGLQSAADKTKLDAITVDTATVVRKYVRNNSGVPIPKGAAVYQTSSSGTTLTVALADASAEATAAQTLGLAQEAIAHNASGWIVAVGQLDGISTATLTEGQIVWLSETAGEGTTTRPTQPAHGVVLGYCVKQGSGTSGILYVKVDNGLEIEELHDVLISGATTGQVLRLASDGLWKNHTLTPADVGGHDAVTLAASVADVLDLSGQELRADDPGADRILFWDDSEGKLRHLSLGTGLSISGTTISATATGGGTKTLQRFSPRDNQPPASAFATIDTRNSVSVLEFDAATAESVVFVGIIPEAATLTSGLLVRIWWMADTATSGNVRWSAAFERSGTDLDADSFDTATEVTSAANGTSGIETVAEITCTAIDSLVAGDRYRLRIQRVATDAVNDTMTGDAQLVAVEVRQVA